MTEEHIHIEPLLKAFRKFETFKMHLSTEQEQAGAIQAFEYSFELGWKTMKRLLDARGKTAHSPKETFRMAALEGFIDNPESWFDFLKKRNLTVHTYEEAEAKEVLSVFPLFSQAMHAFIKKIGGSV